MEIDPVELEVVMHEERRTQLKQDKLELLQFDSREKDKISNYKLFQRVPSIFTGDNKGRLHEPRSCLKKCSQKKYCVTYRILLNFCLKNLLDTKRFQRCFSITPEIL